jgi:hypothetical protein
MTFVLGRLRLYTEPTQVWAERQASFPRFLYQMNNITLIALISEQLLSVAARKADSLAFKGMLRNLLS